MFSLLPINQVRYKEVYNQITADGQVSLREFNSLLALASKDGAFLTADDVDTFFDQHLCKRDKLDVNSIFYGNEPHVVDLNKKLGIGMVGAYIWYSQGLIKDGGFTCKPLSAPNFGKLFKPE